MTLLTHHRSEPIHQALKTQYARCHETKLIVCFYNSRVFFYNSRGFFLMRCSKKGQKIENLKVIENQINNYRICLSISRIFLYQDITQKVRCDLYTNT